MRFALMSNFFDFTSTANSSPSVSVNITSDSYCARCSATLTSLMNNVLVVNVNKLDSGLVLLLFLAKNNSF